jgi:hypothetical protein
MSTKLFFCKLFVHFLCFFPLHEHYSQFPCPPGI